MQIKTHVKVNFSYRLLTLSIIGYIPIHKWWQNCNGMLTNSSVRINTISIYFALRIRYLVFVTFMFWRVCEQIHAPSTVMSQISFRTHRKTREWIVSDFFGISLYSNVFWNCFPLGFRGTHALLLSERNFNNRIGI